MFCLEPSIHGYWDYQVVLTDWTRLIHFQPTISLFKKCIFKMEDKIAQRPKNAGFNIVKNERPLSRQFFFHESWLDFPFSILKCFWYMMRAFPYMRISHQWQIIMKRRPKRRKLAARQPQVFLVGNSGKVRRDIRLHQLRMTKKYKTFLMEQERETSAKVL